MKICFVALELLGPFSGGGIATALAGQVEHHAGGHDVTVLYVNPDLSEEEGARWQAKFATRGVRFLQAEFDTAYPLDTIPKRSFAVKDYLSAWDERFDLIVFHDYLGLGYFTALARKLGLAFQDSRILTVVHGPSQWARGLNLALDTADDIPVYELERKQTEMSDFVTGPSQHILNWCTGQGWSLPATARPVGNLLPVRTETHSGRQPEDVVTGLDEVAFFGRLEVRKGLYEFLDAITYLHKNRLRLPRQVTFLGGFCTASERNTAAIVLDHAQNWSCEVQFLNNLDHEAAIGWLTANLPLTVVPSHDESFGLTAYECLSFGVPVLMSDRGALSSLPADPSILVEPSAHLIAHRIDDALRNGWPISAIAPEHLDTAADWDALLEEVAASPSAPGPHAALATLDGPADAMPETAGDDLVSVVMVHHNRATLFADALASVLAQTHQALEIIVVDDGSRPADLAALERVIAQASDDRISLYTQQNSYLGAARNLGASKARGRHILFMDDDNVAHVGEVETFLAVARRTGADILTATSRMFRSTDIERHGFDIYCPVGPSLPLAIVSNPFGDANALVRRDTFERLGGFTERYGVGCEDYEFFTRAFMSGARMQVVPQVLFDYRSDDDGMMKELNSGKYLVNQLRGSSPVFDTGATVPLTALRGVLHVAQTAGLAREQRYWAEEGLRRRRFPELEEALSRHRNRPNGPEAVGLIVRMLAGLGRMREAVTLMERNGLTPDDEMLAQMHSLMIRAERRAQNGGEQANIALNPAFEFWDLGRRFEGVTAYQYVANDWLLPSSKDRESLVISQERDNSLFALSIARQPTYLRLRLLAPDPQGYLFLTQRNTDLSRCLGNVLRLSLLARASFEGGLTAFLRVTEEHGTERFKDIWPDSQGWVSRDWSRSEMLFDLTDFPPMGATDTMLVSLFLRVPTDADMALDIADVTMVPDGEDVTIAPYHRETERQRVAERCFLIGRDLDLIPDQDGCMRVTLPAVLADRLSAECRLRPTGPVTVRSAKGTYAQVSCTACRWDPGAGNLLLSFDRALDGPATAQEDFLLVTRYLEG